MEVPMELQSARQIIDTLAQGIHPVTGELMPDDSPYNAPPVIRALFAVSRALEGGQPVVRVRKPVLPNAGKPWSPEDEATLTAGFTADPDLKQLAQQMGRTRAAVEARLVKLGKLEARSSLPFSAGGGL
jgi:hypothetical protein